MATNIKPILNILKKNEKRKVFIYTRRFKASSPQNRGQNLTLIDYKHQKRQIDKPPNPTFDQLIKRKKEKTTMVTIQTSKKKDYTDNDWFESKAKQSTWEVATRRENGAGEDEDEEEEASWSNDVGWWRFGPTSMKNMIATACRNTVERFKCRSHPTTVVACLSDSFLSLFFPVASFLTVSAF